MLFPEIKLGKNLKRCRVFLVLVIAFHHSFVYAQTPAGRVILATGAVSAQDQGGPVRVLGKGSAVFSGDRITTASKSLCVLKMIDDAKMTIRADSEIVIEAYVFNKSATDSSVMKLVKGGFRALTGTIGKNNRNAYKINSDLSVLGIRGTDYDTRICEPGRCMQLGGSGPEYGQYTSVVAGGVYMDAGTKGCVPGVSGNKTNKCILDIVAGQAGFVGLEEIGLLEKVPALFSQDPTPSPADIQDTASPLNSVQSCQL